MSLRPSIALLLAFALACRPPAEDSAALPVRDSGETGETGAPPEDTAPPTPPYTACRDGEPLEHFVLREGGQLMLDGQPFRFASLNMPDLSMIDDPGWELPDPWEQRDALCSIHQLGGQVTRSYVISVGDSWNDTARHVTAPGAFSEEAFAAMDHLLDQANQQGVRLIIPLVDQWAWWGGIAEYAAFRGLEPPAFWTDPQLLDDFLLTVEHTVGRVNTVTGVPYAEDPAILAWETGNELDAPQAWTATVAARIRELDPNHLILDGHYGVDEASLDNPDIDIVGNHFYWPAGYGSDYPRALADDLATVAGRRPYILGELGLIDSAVITATFEAFAASEASGIMLWALRGHDKDGGFHWHNEIDDGHTLVRAYHWPGFDAGDAYDEREVLSLVRETAWAVRGLEVEPLPVPEPPEILGISPEGEISWRGTPGAASYTLERTEIFDCCPEEVADRFHDAVEPSAATVRDPYGEPGQTWSYLMRACNESGCSELSEATEGFVHPERLVDELDDLSLPSGHSDGLILDDSNTGYFAGDASRLTRAATTAEQVVYTMNNEPRFLEVQAWFWPHEAREDLLFATSDDGADWTPLDVEIDEMGGDWTEVIYRSESLPSDARQLRITWQNLDGQPWSPQIGRLEIGWEPERGW